MDGKRVDKILVVPPRSREPRRGRRLILIPLSQTNFFDKQNNTLYIEEPFPGDCPFTRSGCRT